MHEVVNVNIQLDAEVKEAMEKVCEDLGVSMDSVFRVLAEKFTCGEIAKEDYFPVPVENDPFLTENDLKHIAKIVQGIEDGTGHFTQHDLIEVEDDD